MIFKYKKVSNNELPNINNKWASVIDFFKNIKIKLLSKKYKEELSEYVKLINEYRAEGMESKWLEKPQKEAPIYTLEKYAKEIYQTVVGSNQNNKIEDLRSLFPPLTEVLYSLADAKDTISDIIKIVAISG